MTSEEEQLVPVFQPFPSLILKLSDICEEGDASYLKSFFKNEESYIAMSLSSCGVVIYKVTDISSPKIVYYNKLEDFKGVALDINLSKDENYLFVANSMGYVFTISLITTPFTLLSQIQSDGGVQVNSVVEMNSGYYILLCPLSFQVYKWSGGNENWVHQFNVKVNGQNLSQMEFFQNYSYAIVSASNLGVVFFKIENTPSLKFTQSCVLKPYFFDVNKFSMINDNTIAIMLQFKGIYMYDLSDYFSQKGLICSTTIFKYITQTPSQGLGGMMALSKDHKYLFTQFRSIGVLVYDISQKMFTLVQTLFVDQNSKDISLSEVTGRTNLLFYSNSDSLHIFQRTTPNFNRDVPNLLLNEYQQVSYSDYKESPTMGNLDYSCLYKEEEQNFYMSRANFGTSVFKYRGQGILEYTAFINRAPSIYPTSFLVFLQDKTRAYACRGDEGLVLINFSDPQLPFVEKSKITMDQPFVHYTQIKFKSDFSVGFLPNMINILVIEASDPQNPTKISSFNTLSLIKSPSCDKIILSKNEKFAVIICYLYGILVVDISNYKNIKHLSTLYTESAYDVKLTDDQNYLVIATGYKGVLIAKLDENKNVSQISSVSIIGAGFQVKTIKNDNFVIATSNENPSIQLINIVDKYQPSVIQRFGKQTAFSYYSLCLSKDSSYIFVSSQYQLLILSLQNSIILHTQMYELKSKENSNEYIRIDLKKDQILKIGQQIEMHLVPIYQTKQLQISKAFYYKEFILQELPYWMEYTASRRILSLKVSRESLQKDQKGNYIKTVQQVVFLAYQQIDSLAFVHDYLDISPTDSANIRQICVDQGLLTNEYFVIETYSPKKKFTLGPNENVYLDKWVQTNTSQKVKRFIQYIINQNIINYTTSFTITDSISVDLNNKQQIIQSSQTDITIQMSVVESYVSLEGNVNNLDPSHFKLATSAKFVNKNYSSILVLLSEKQNEIKLEGSLSNINTILFQGIKFSINNNIKDYSNIFIRIVISDGVNYNYDKIIHYKYLSFLSMQAPVKVSETTSLSSDFKSKFTNGNIFIVENFSYQISLKVFTNLDEKNLIHTAQIMLNGELQEIPKDFWLQYSQTDRIFSGTPPPSEFQKIYTIRVNATDGYTFAFDQFSISPALIPFSYALQFAIQVFGPIFGILGLWKYQHLFYNITFKKHYTYSKEIVYVGEVYKKQIPTSNNLRDNLVDLWKFFLKTYPQQEIQEQVQTEIKKNKNKTAYKIDQFIIEFDKNDQKQSFSDALFSKIYKFGANNTILDFNEKDKEKNQMSFNLDQLQSQSKNIELEMSSRNEQSNQDQDYHQQYSGRDQQGMGVLSSGRQPINPSFVDEPNSNRQQLNNSIDQQQNILNNNMLSSARNDQVRDQQPTLNQSIRQQNNSQQDKLSNQPKNDSVSNNSPQLNSWNNSKKMSRQSLNINKISKKIAKSIVNSKLSSSIQIKSKINTNDQIQNTEYIQSNYTIKLFTHSGKINFQEINKFIYDRQKELPQKKRLGNEQELEELLNDQSMIYQGLSALASEHFLSFNILSKQIFEQLRYKSMKFYKDIDWYKAFLHIVPTFQNIHFNPFPDITTDITTLYAAIREICQQIYINLNQERQLPNVNASNKNSLHEENLASITTFSIELIQQALKAKAIGFQISSLKLLQKTCGETIHTYSSSIHSIKAFEKNNDIKYCFGLRKLLNHHYIEKGLTINDPLPSWIQQVDQIHGVIILGGTPEKKDVGSCLIKVYDEDMFIIRSYKIKIIEKENNNTVDLNRQKDNSFYQSQRGKGILNSSFQQKSSTQINVNQNRNTQTQNSNKRAEYTQKKNRSNFAPDLKQKMAKLPSFQESDLEIQKAQSNYSENENGSPYLPTRNNSIQKSHNNSTQGTEQFHKNLENSPPSQIYLNKNHQDNHGIQTPSDIKNIEIDIQHPSKSNQEQINQEKSLPKQKTNEKPYYYHVTSKDIEQNNQQNSKTIQPQINQQIELQQITKKPQQIELNQMKDTSDFIYTQQDLNQYYNNYAGEPQSVDTSFNPVNCQQQDITGKSFINENNQLEKSFKDISMNFNITEKYQINVERQIMNKGDSQILDVSDMI